MQKVFIIEGLSEIDKTTFVNTYLKIFSGSLLIGGRYLAFYSGVNHFFFREISLKDIEECKQCPILVVDTIFLLLEDSLHREIVLDILAFRFRQSKCLLFIGNVEQFEKSKTEIIKKLFSDAQIWNMNGKSGILAFSVYFFRLKYSIDIKRSMRLSLLEVNDGGLNYTDTVLVIPSGDWSGLLQEESLLQLLEEGLLQCVAMDENGDDFYSADVALLRGKEHIKELLKCENLTTFMREKLNIVLDTWIDDGISELRLGVDLFKNKKG